MKLRNISFSQSQRDVGEEKCAVTVDVLIAFAQVRHEVKGSELTSTRHSAKAWTESYGGGLRAVVSHHSTTIGI